MQSNQKRKCPQALVDKIGDTAKRKKVEGGRRMIA
jgi:hypothetical protein